MNTHFLKGSTHAVAGSHCHGRAGNRGFALLITLSLLVLLTVIAVGLLSLSAVTLRSNSKDQAQMQARANARLALQMAIGELQRNAGLDTRVTASADILDDEANTPSNLAVTGVWKSWEGDDHTTSGAAAARPIAPDYDSKRQPASSANGRFVSWLVSKPQTVSEGDLISDASGWSVSDALQQIVRNTSFDGSVPMVSTGSLAAGDAREVHVVPVPIKNSESQRGAYAWWVSGENQKARLPVPYKPANDNDAAAWSLQAKSHATADPSALDLDPVLAADGPAKAAKALSLGTSTLLVNDPLKPNPAKLFHDMSAVSVGLLTNTATGGWRKDLSLFTENWDRLPDSGAEVFRLTPDASATAKMTKPKRLAIATAALTTAANYAEMTPAGSVFYPWSRHRVPGGSNVVRARAWTAAVTSWHHLKDYATLYKKIELQGGKPAMPSKMTYARFTGGPKTLSWTGLTYGEAFFDYHHTARVMPVLGRTQMVYYLSSQRVSNDPVSPDYNKYRVQIGTDPLITLWNPYNTTLKTTPQWTQYPRSLPPAFRFNIGSQTTDYHQYYFGIDGANFRNRTFAADRANWVCNRQYGEISFKIHRDPVTPSNKLYSQLMAPGVTKVFSKNATTSNVVGYTPVGATIPPTTAIKPMPYPIDIQRWDPALVSYVSLAFDAGDTISIDARFDAGIYKDTSGVVNVGVYSDLGIDEMDVGSGQCMALKTRIGYTFAMANALWPPIPQGDFPEYRVGDLYDPGDPTATPPRPPGPKPKPFMSMMFGPRLATDSNTPAKGFLQSDPLLSQTNMGQWALVQGVAEGQNLYGSTRGITNPVNAAFDLSFVPHTGGIDSRMPNVSQDGQNRGYIVTGVQSGDGLSRIATVELPLRPLGSLAELQHWGLRADNLTPPYQSYIIANSDAQPLFAPNAVAGANADTNIPYNLQHDDSYCANHLLFDDWFFSTIAPQPTTFGPTGKTLQETFTALVRDGAPLDNRAYRPILEDRSITPAQAADLFTNKVNAADSYRGIASRLEVDGMFNVNSTSVKAWRALLGHARNQRMPYYDNNGDMVLSDPTDYATSRTTVASDVAGGENGTSGTFPDASEYSGYRVFTDGMLDQMAEEMVRQVRKRGPFLSLSEFVNRQLTDYDTELALAGAVQSALNVLAAKKDAEAALNPYSALQADSLNAGLTVLTAQNKQAGSDFTYFPEASEGKSAYGMPGWLRQADILRPLAPILTARDDTFTIRAYGDARDANGNIAAHATCEAIVRRDRGFVSPGQDAADITGPPTAAANQEFGRRFQLVSFRWLHPDEI